MKSWSQLPRKIGSQCLNFTPFTQNGNPMFISSNQVNQPEINAAITRWQMSRWHMQQRCADNAARLEASLASLYNAIMAEFEKNFPISSKQPAQFEKMCNFAAKVAYGTP